MRVKYPIIVEGKYDKIKLDSLIDATIITTGGFEIFNSKEKALLIKRLCEKDKIILLTDSDGGGHLIRSHIKTMLPSDKVINLYIPRVEGKEKRKSAPSKAGTLGVEGIEAKKLLEILSPYFEDAPKKEYGCISKADFYSYGLSGRQNSQEKRKALLKKLELPLDMSPNAILQAVNMLFTKEEFQKLMEK